jgi:FkbM family methyltransferase
MKYFQFLINKILEKFNLRLMRLSNYSTLLKYKSKSFDITFIKHMRLENIHNILKYIDLSQSQHKQDLFVLNELNFKKKGFFIEFGAADGKYLSNTYLLEKEFIWSGILVEPARIFHEKLLINRNCIIDNNCVWKNSNSKLRFIETNRPELSMLKQFENLDSIDRSYKNIYDVETISLNDLLIKYQAPKIIDYLSIDTEGSEYDILCNFKNYQFKIITCEHSFDEKRILVNKLLLKNGYIQTFEEISKVDDWYINPSIV